MPQKKIRKKNHKKIEGINSLRFLAFLMVFFFHFSDVFYFGFLGVDFFFVLSSFLLTYLAFKEIDKTKEFSKRNFFIRRVLRIFPLYYLIVFLGFIILPFIANIYNIEITLPEKKYLFWIFLSNYDTSHYLLPMEFLWSIAVEEQFYILFIFLAIFFKKYVGYVISSLVFIYLVYYMVDDYYHWEHYKNVFFHLANFGFGILGGYLFFREIKPLKIILLSFIISLVLLFLVSPSSLAFNIILSIWFVSIIFTIDHYSQYVRNLKAFHLTEYLGKFTYGMYVYSGFIIVFFNKLNFINNKLLLGFMELIVIFVISFISYHLFEKHFLKLKSRFRYHSTP